MLEQVVAIILAVRCKSEIATRQLLAKLNNEYIDPYPKILMLKTINLLTPLERDWLRSLY